MKPSNVKFILTFGQRNYAAGKKSWKGKKNLFINDRQKIKINEKTN